MLTLHPRLVESGSPADDDDGSRICFCVVVTCVSLLLFIVLAAAVSIARAATITGAVMLLLLLVIWLAPTGTGTGRAAQQSPTAAPVVRLVHYRCGCGLTDAAIGALPSFAYEAPAAKEGDGDDGSGKPRRSSVMCAVCLEDVQAGEMVRQLPACSHLFHVDCVDAWLRAHRTCPLCRRCLSPLNVTAKATAAAETSDDMLPPV